MHLWHLLNIHSMQGFLNFSWRLRLQKSYDAGKNQLKTSLQVSTFITTKSQDCCSISIRSSALITAQRFEILLNCTSWQKRWSYFSSILFLYYNFSHKSSEDILKYWQHGQNLKHSLRICTLKILFNIPCRRSEILANLFSLPKCDLWNETLT